MALDLIVTFKEPLKLQIAPGIGEFEVLRVRGLVDGADGTSTKSLTELWGKTVWRIDPLKLFTTKQQDWIDLADSSVVMRTLIVPMNSVAAALAAEQRIGPMPEKPTAA